MIVSSLRAWLVPTRGLLPATLCTYSTAGFSIRYSTARSVTIRVRSNVAPSGSSNSILKYPWSSMGRKLVGIMRWINRMAINTMPNVLSTRRGCFTMCLMSPTYLWLPIASHLLIRRNMIFFFLFGSSGFRISEHMTGLSVKATTVDSNTDTTMVTVNWR